MSFLIKLSRWRFAAFLKQPLTTIPQGLGRKVQLVLLTVNDEEGEAIHQQNIGPNMKKVMVYLGIICANYFLLCI